MTYINYVTTIFVTRDKLSSRQLKRAAAEIQNTANVVVLDAEELGIVKEGDLDYELPQPFGHVHHSDSDNGEYCRQGSNSCYQRAQDNVHATDN